MELKEEIINIIPNFFDYYLSTDITDYDSINDFIVSTLEHEIDLYKNYKEEGFKDKQKVSYINKSNIKKVNGLLKRYYNSEV